MAQISWEPFLKRCSLCCHPLWPHHAEAELPLLRDPLLPAHWELGTSLGAAFEVSATSENSLWHRAVLQNKFTTAVLL